MAHTIRTPTQTAGRTGFGLNLATLSPAHWAAMGLATVTGVVHLYLYWTQEYVPFLLAGVVFLAATVGVLLNVYRRALYALGIPFTLGQVFVWAMQGMPDMQVAMVDKPVQVALVVLLGYLLWTERR